VQYDFKVVQLNFTWFTMEVYYKKNKILLKSFIKDPTTNKSTLQSEQLVDYEKGMKYTINNADKTIIADSMLNNIVYTKIKSQENAVSKILNYTCSKSVYDTIIKPNGEVDTTGVFYYADDLPFNVPGIYSNVEPAPFLGGTNHVCLSATITTTIYRHATTKVNIAATSVTSKSLPDSLFNLPENFKTTITQKKGLYEIKLSEIKREPASNVPPPPPPPVPSKPIKNQKSKTLKKSTAKPI